MIKSGFAALIIATLALSGCRVQTVDGRIVGPAPQPVAQRALDIEGPWLLLRQDKVKYSVDVIRTRGGILIDSRKRRDFAARVAPGVFETENQRTFQFFSAVEGRFENRVKGTFLTMVRP